MKKSLLTIPCLLAVLSISAQLTYKGRFKEYEAGMSGISLVQALAFSPDGKNCYIGSYNGFTWYEVDYTTHNLLYKGTLTDGGDGGPGVSDGHGVIVSPDGKFIYLASGYMEHSISVYTRNAVTGAPVYKEITRDGDMGISNMKYPYGIDQDHAGKNVYVACKDWDGNSLVWFSRNSTTGSLTYMSKFVDGAGGCDGLLSADDVSLSPDDKNVYVTAFGDNALTWYNRDVATGNLTLGGMLKDNAGGVDGLGSPYWVEVSPDGKFVYVGAQDDNSIAWFSRNTTNGALTYVDRITDPAILSGTRGISIHPSGDWLFASALSSNTVSWYSVNKTTGKLTNAGYRKNGVDGVDGIGGTRYNALSPDGTMFIATGYGDNSVAWFSWPASSAGALQTPVAKRVTVYPNPVKDEIHLNNFEDAAIGSGRIMIYNSLGALVQSAAIEGGSTIKFYGAAGVYCYRIVDENQMPVETGTLIKE